MLDKCYSNTKINGVNYVNGMPVVHGRSYHTKVLEGDLIRVWYTEDGTQIRKIRKIRLTNRQ